MSDQMATTAQAVLATGLPADALVELEGAAGRLRGGSGVLVRMADLLGGVMSRSVRLGVRSFGMAPDLQDKMRGLAGAALTRAFDVAILNIKSERPRSRRGREMTRAVVVTSGAVGGFLGLGGFIPDITVTTLAIMRSIARIAQEEGEDLAAPDTRAACLQVFALTPGGAEKSESDVGYYSARLILQGRPLVLLIGEVSGRYGINISQKLALQTVPFIGAVCGAALNSVFLRHYQDAARAHFVIRRLERTYGADVVRNAWSNILPS